MLATNMVNGHGRSALYRPVDQYQWPSAPWTRCWPQVPTRPSTPRIPQTVSSDIDQRRRAKACCKNDLAKSFATISTPSILAPDRDRGPCGSQGCRSHLRNSTGSTTSLRHAITPATATWSYRLEAAETSARLQIIGTPARRRDLGFTRATFHPKQPASVAGSSSRTASRRCPFDTSATNGLPPPRLWNARSSRTQDRKAHSHFNPFTASRTQPRPTGLRESWCAMNVRSAGHRRGHNPRRLSSAGAILSGRLRKHTSTTRRHHYSSARLGPQPIAGSPRWSINAGRSRNPTTSSAARPASVAGTALTTTGADGRRPRYGRGTTLDDRCRRTTDAKTIFRTAPPLGIVLGPSTLFGQSKPAELPVQQPPTAFVRHPRPRDEQPSSFQATVPSGRLDHIGVRQRRKKGDCSATAPRKDHPDAQVLNSISTGPGRLLPAQSAPTITLNRLATQRPPTPHLDADTYHFVRAFGPGNSGDVRVHRPSTPPIIHSTVNTPGAHLWRSKSARARQPTVGPERSPAHYRRPRLDRVLSRRHRALEGEQRVSCGSKPARAATNPASRASASRHLDRDVSASRAPNQRR